MFPSRNVLKNLPPVFKHFKNVRCVIDCTEFFCHVPRNYRHQGNVFSANKHYTTLKALIAVAPNGTAIFISDLFEGSTDDVTITEKSGFLDHIEPGDLILADKGFEIEELLLCKGAHSKLPAKLNGRAKLTKGEELETRRIAKARIHIERFNERLNKRRPYDSPDPPHRSIFHTPWCKRRTNTPASRSPSPTLHSITSPRLAAASAEFRHIPPLILASTQTPASSSLAAAPPPPSTYITRPIMVLVLKKLLEHVVSSKFNEEMLYQCMALWFSGLEPKEHQVKYKTFLVLYFQLLPQTDFNNLPDAVGCEKKKKRMRKKTVAPSILGGKIRFV